MRDMPAIIEPVLREWRVMICIDCSRQRAVMVTQQRQVGRSVKQWHVCLECLVAYNRETAQIQRELEQEAIGKLSKVKR